MAASLITDLGPGESQVLMSALKVPGSIALLDAKRARHLIAVKPSLDRLQELGFRLAKQTREAVL